jgi:hypothetical protein
MISISAGDRVYVWGDLELSSDQNKLVAEGLMELIDGPGGPKMSGKPASSPSEQGRETR